ncbi:hypothetical protein Vretimale_7663 [Volvox reticuliferus]|uniref:Uncharacterized protein n=1 Tax=Volvox reticuliferus TaxID=1737510 RepID=A0A8J4LMU4_9CHLO|nr:hypothetical protein Vretifemale_7751 [Volvox reticuliferus]GIM02825.1 hypothetical protein Vretimale_7663 [Volvox reticuliferus]
MHPTLASAGAQRAVCKPLRPTTSQRALIAARSCASAPETATSREHLALAVASFLTSTIVAVSSASPAFADEAVAVTISSASVENALALDAVIDGVDVVDASAKVEVAGVVEAPPPATPFSEPGASSPESPVLEVVDAQSEELPALRTAVEAEEVNATASAAIPSIADEPAIEEVLTAATSSPTDAAVPSTDLLQVDLKPQTEAEAVLPEEAEAVVVAAPEVVAAEAVPEVTAVTVSGSEATELTSLQPVEAVLAEQPAPVDDLTVVAAVEAGAEGGAAEGTVVAAADPVEVAPAEVVVPVLAAAEGVTEEVEVPSLSAVVEAVVPELPPVPEPTVMAGATEAAAAAATDVVSPSSVLPSGGLDLQALFAGATAAASSGEGPSAETLTYGVLGATAVSFIATFFVAPRFKEEFKVGDSAAETGRKGK